jgi:hypothetical protein
MHFLNATIAIGRQVGRDQGVYVRYIPFRLPRSRPLLLSGIHFFFPPESLPSLCHCFVDQKHSHLYYCAAVDQLKGYCPFLIIPSVYIFLPLHLNPSHFHSDFPYRFLNNSTRRSSPQPNLSPRCQKYSHLQSSRILQPLVL